MRRGAYAHCKRCGRSREEAGIMTRTRLCVDCSKILCHENLEGLMLRDGPALLRWRRAVAAGVGGILLDDLPAYLETHPQ